MSQLIDRRLNGKNRSAVNRQRFVRRFKQQIKQSVTDAVSGRSITDIDRGEKVSIPKRDLSEPEFRLGPGGRREVVLPGNREFVTGDRIERPPSEGGQGGKGSPDGEGEDEFSFQLSRDEFLNIFFEDLALPDLVKTQLARDPSWKSVRAGYATTGVPANINVVRSLRGAMARRLVTRAPLQQKLDETGQELAEAQALQPPNPTLVAELEQEIARLRRRMEHIPYIDTFDLRYNHRVKEPQPSTAAVMFCLMDVSGSMDQARKDMAKRFFILLYLFLERAYQRIEVVFIRHHTAAREVDEKDFFQARESGGTVVSSALNLLRDIVRERYTSSDWNVYVAQASDGDNWDQDSDTCRELLMESIMPLVQYYAYVEIGSEEPQSLWTEYVKIAAAYRNFAMQRIIAPGDIYPVFRHLFKRKVAAWRGL